MDHTEKTLLKQMVKKWHSDQIIKIPNQDYLTTGINNIYFLFMQKIIDVWLQFYLEVIECTSSVMWGFQVDIAPEVVGRRLTEEYNSTTSKYTPHGLH